MVRALCVLVVAALALSPCLGIQYAPQWSTQVRASTYFKNYVPGEYSTNYAALVEDTYLITDVDTRLYAINKTTGEIQWSFNGWGQPDIAPSVAAQRQISGAGDYVWIWLGKYVYSFQRVTGQMNFRREFGFHPHGTLSAVDGNILLMQGSSTVIFEPLTGYWINKFNGTYSGAFRVSGSILASLVCLDNQCNIVVDKYTGRNITHLAKIPSSSEVYIMTVTSEYVFYIATGFTTAVRYDFATQSVRYTISAPDGFRGYAFTPTQFQMRGLDHGKAYDLSSGEQLAYTGKIPNLNSKLEWHIMGFENYIVLGFTNMQGVFNVTSWSVKDGGKLAWALVPPSEGSHLFGNFGHTVLIPAKDQFTVIDAGSGQYATVGPFKELSFASMVQTDTEMVFSYNATVTAARY